MAGSVRCGWHGVARTIDQREEALRVVQGLSDSDQLPTSEQTRAKLTSYVAIMAPEYRHAMQVNFDHLVERGLLEDGQILACHVDYTVSDYLLGDGSSNVTVSYDHLGKTRSYELYQHAHGAGRYGDTKMQTDEDYRTNQG